ncbi:MAG: hypothetical protein QM479_16745 [Pseudomonadota bacterium]
MDIADEIVDDWDDVILENAAEEALQQEFFYKQKIKYKKQANYSKQTIKSKQFKNETARPQTIVRKKQSSVKNYTKRYQLKPYKSPLQSSKLYQKRYNPK